VARITHHDDAMRSMILMLAVCACDPQRLACDEDCAPGAIIGGRIYDRYTWFGVSPSGVAVRAFGDRVERLDADLLPAGDPPPPLESGLASPRPHAIAVDDDGAVTELLVSSSGEQSSSPMLLVHTDASLRRAWSFPTSLVVTTVPTIAASSDVIALSLGSNVFAFDAPTGAPLWQRQLAANIAVAGDEVLLAGDGSLTSIGADNAVRWTTTFSPDVVGASATLGMLATGPNGEIAITGVWTGGSATLLGTTFPAPPPNTSSRMVAILDPAATRVVWSQPLQMTDVRSMVTDGTRVILAGGYLSTTAASESGVEWTRSSGLEQPMWAESISNAGIFAAFALEGAYEYGDVRGDDAGVAIVKLAP
jgi:outer membrane protein assembly factor BamB